MRAAPVRDASIVVRIDRDVDPHASYFFSILLGLYASVIEAGSIGTGDAVELVPRSAT
jgi:MOSC domain-containing protein YiiM